MKKMRVVMKNLPTIEKSKKSTEHYEMTKDEINVVDYHDKITSDFDKRFSEIFVLKLGNPVRFETVAA
jgi:hypothetical protein